MRHPWDSGAADRPVSRSWTRGTTRTSSTGTFKVRDTLAYLHRFDTDTEADRQSDNDRLVLANMTLYAQDGLPIVVLERFEELNVSVNCRDDEGILVLTFGSTDALDYAEEQWGYVNKADDGRFLLIANHDGCGPDDQRQAYMSVYCVFSTIVWFWLALTLAPQRLKRHERGYLAHYVSGCESCSMV